MKLLEEFKHVNIVSYRESIIEGQELNIVMEFCSGGDLNQLITEQKEAGGGRRLDEKKGHRLEYTNSTSYFLHAR